jgi:hypothetical protein
MSSAKKSAAAAERKDPTDLLNGETIKDALVRAGLSTKGSVLEMATRLQSHFTSDPEHVKNGSREYDCDVDAGGCGYPFPTNLQTCAFCGRAAEEGDKDAPVSPTPIPTSGVVRASGAALADADEQEKKLDYAVERARVFSREMVGAGWDLGNTIKQIYEQKLFLARRGKDGAPVHPTLEAFCKAELQMTSTYARNLIDVATNFTRAQVVSLGTTKLVAIARVDPGPERDRLLEEAPEKSAAEIGREVRTVVAAQPPKKDRRGQTHGGGRKMTIGGARDLPSAEPTPAIYPPPSTFTRAPVAPFLSDAPAPEGAPPVEDVVVPPPRRLTLAAEEGTYKVLLYAPRKTPLSKPRAQTLADSPKGRIKMLNDTEIVVVVGKSDKGLWVKLSFLELGGAAKKNRRAKAALVRAKKKAEKEAAES